MLIGHNIRTTMTQKKICNLALVSIEQKLCGRVIFNNIFSDFAEIKALITNFMK